MPNAHALSRIAFDDDESENYGVSFALNNIYFLQSDLVIPAETKLNLK